MPQVIDTSVRHLHQYSAEDNYQIYCGLDNCLTREILDATEPNLDEDTAHIYEFEREMQAPLLEMTGRGVLVDKRRRQRMVDRLSKAEDRYLELVDELSMAVWDQPLTAPNKENPKKRNQPTNAALKHFFFTVMKLPIFRVQVGRGKWEVSTNREALEKIRDLHVYARPFVNVILALRDVTKKIQTLSTGIDEDGRFRTSFNIAATVTGRLSSSENAFGTGGNFQNITGDLRTIFVADPGKKLGYFDLAQAESRGVGVLAYLVTGTSKYLDACEAGDLHTTVSKLCWPMLPWTGDLKKDKDLAEERFYRMFSRRDLAKRGGHGSNYYAQPPTISRNLKIGIDIAKSFQDAYFRAFPELPFWHDWTIDQIIRNQTLLTPLRRYRQFFDRPKDAATHRAAIAHVPQSMIADMVDRSLIEIWRSMPEVQCLLQVHDAIVVQYPEELEDIVVPKIIRGMTQTIAFDEFEVFCPFKRHNIIAPARKFSIGSDAQTGWNWGKEVSPEYAAKKGIDVNPLGMRNYAGPGADDRYRPKFQQMSKLEEALSRQANISRIAGR